MGKKRDMNFELLRIVAMILIICAHYMGPGGVYGHVGKFNSNYYITELIRAFTSISVNVYVMITGYYMVTSNMKIKKLINICLVVWFYSVLSLLIPITLKENINYKEIIPIMFMPISSGLYWFPTIYIALYALSPFINKLVQNLTKKQYITLIAILTVFIIGQRLLFSANEFIIPRVHGESGKSLIWFVYLYIIAGYIRLHYKGKVNKAICLGTTLIIPFIIVAIRTISLKNTGNEMNKLLESAFILNFISTITIFLFFKEVKIKNETCNKIIGKISPLMFGVYIIHENHFVLRNIYSKVLYVQEYYTNIYLPLHMTISVVWIFITCSLIEKVRMEAFAIIGETKVFKKIGAKLDQINEKFNNMMNEA